MYKAKLLLTAVKGKIARRQIKKAVSLAAEHAPDKGEVPGTTPGRPKVGRKYNYNKNNLFFPSLP